MPRTALYAGSFDPVTNGHLDVVRQAARLADRLVLAIGIHPGKTPLFQRRRAARHARGDLRAGARARAAASSPASPSTTSWSRPRQREGATLLIRGLRNATDFDYEMQMAGMNGAMAPDVQTVFLPASPAVRPITATLVRQIAAMGGDVSPFVPAVGRGPAEGKIRRQSRPLNREIIMIRLLAALAALVCAVPALAQANCRPALDPQNTLLIDTTHGRIVVKLRNDLAPKHAERIKQLARESFYDNVPFHRVIAGFMAQTGDGQSGDGTGGSKYPEFAGRVLQCAVQARHRRHGAGERHRTRRIRSSSSCMPTAPSSTASTRCRERSSPGMDVVDKIKKGEPVANPDRMTRVQVAADAK